MRGKEGGEQGEKKKEKKNWLQLTEIKLCSVTLLKKEGGLFPTRSHATAADALSKMLPVQFSISLPQRSEMMPLLRG